MKVGILAIQGDYYLHKLSLDALNINSMYVRESEDLKKCDSLILPGGESTTISLLLTKYHLYDNLIKYSKTHTMFGICAGSILMSKDSNDIRIRNFNCINLITKRNAWGSQINSFSDHIIFNNKFKLNRDETFFASFIRAPKFFNIGIDCKILASYDSSPVLVRNKLHLVSSFHPEIGNDLSIYKYYLSMINGS